MLDKDGQPHPLINWRARTVREIDELIGLCKGIIADGVVNESEAKFLEHWLRLNRESQEVWPGSVLFPRITSMLEDGKLSSEEELELLKLLMSISGGDPSAIHAHSLSCDLPLDDPVPRIDFEDNMFCFTGKMISGPRASCEREVVKRGGIITRDVNQDLSFLVIGTIGSRDWLHSTFGRKIEKAVTLRDKGLALKIVSEEPFAVALR